MADYKTCLVQRDLAPFVNSPGSSNATYAVAVTGIPAERKCRQLDAVPLGSAKLLSISCSRTTLFLSCQVRRHRFLTLPARTVQAMSRIYAF